MSASLQFHVSKGSKKDHMWVSVREDDGGLTLNEVKGRKARLVLHDRSEGLIAANVSNDSLSLVLRAKMSARFGKGLRLGLGVGRRLG